MKRQILLVAPALLLLTLLSFTAFPGRTWLQSDTQIYVPILKRMMDSSLYPQDMVAVRPHVTWTLYDEITIGLSHLTGGELEPALHAQQAVTRFIGLTGVFLLAGAIGLGVEASLLAAACFALGATINGPAVLTVEYEPVPRGFAVMLIMAALGCVSRRWWWWAGAFAGLATLYHPTTAAPFWACALLLAAVSENKREKWPLAACFSVSAIAILCFAAVQHGQTERQPLLGRVGQLLETVQRLRGAYNWIDMWPSAWFWQYPLLLFFVVLAWRRLKDGMTWEARFFTLALPLYGMLMVPVQYLLLDVGKWILIPQFQPARAVLFITAMALLLGIAAGWRAASLGRRWESLAWFALVYAIPANGLVAQLLTQGDWKRVALVAVLAALALAAALWRPALAFAAIVPFFAIPIWGGLVGYSGRPSAEMMNLAGWARTATPIDSVFFFPDVQHGLQPGHFRAYSERSLYVDWKGGGQANLLPELGEEWWKRWQSVKQASPPLLPLGDYGELGIDYLVLRRSNSPAGARILASAAEWVVIPATPVP